MKRDLWSSKTNSQNPGSSSNMQTPPEVDPKTMKDAQAAIEHYGGMSENELMSELKNFRQAGAMDDNALLQMAQTVSPMLTEEQRQRLELLINQLRL